GWRKDESQGGGAGGLDREAAGKSGCVSVDFEIQAVFTTFKIGGFGRLAGGMDAVYHTENGRIRVIPEEHNEGSRL
ncbi:MAG TPA: hypothetical protein VMX35_01920, partial [Acidobacteriota bacterium]|nr:hypothetical protein [Acidobacteriota bacterium]